MLAIQRMWGVKRFPLLANKSGLKRKAVNRNACTAAAAAAGARVDGV